MKSPPRSPREHARDAAGETKGRDARAPSGSSADELAMRVLLVEDDRAAAAAIELILRAEGFECETADLGEEGLEISRVREHELVILDLDLPDIDGYEVLRRLRDARNRTPVLILSGLANIDNRIKGLGYGADDFMTKPFDKRELVARIHAIVRRDRGHGEARVTVGRLSINMDTKTVEIGGKPVHLTGKEFAILEMLASRKGQPVSKQSFMTQLYSADTGDEPASKIIDVFMSKLRKKLMDASGGESYIATIWGSGYVLRDPAARD
jgi:two-component system, cell cycle response regulator CtrA